MTVEHFDGWYADIAASPLRQQIFTDHLGLPAEVSPSNHVPVTGLRSIVTALKVSPGDRIVDLACGRSTPWGRGWRVVIGDAHFRPVPGEHAPVSVFGRPNPVPSETVRRWVSRNSSVVLAACSGGLSDAVWPEVTQN
jgi:hypothetical protein